MLTNKVYVLKGYNLRNELITITAWGLRRAMNDLRTRGVYRATYAVALTFYVSENLVGFSK